MTSRQKAPIALPWPINHCVENPRLGGYIGVVIAVGFAFLWAHTIEQNRSLPDKPVLGSAAEAIQLLEENEDEVWVEIEDGEWDCDNTVRTSSGAAFAVYDPESSRLIIARSDKPVYCSYASQQPLRGTLKPTSEKGLRYLERQGFDLSEQPAGKPVLSLCTYCGGDSALLGVIACPILIVIALCLYPICKYLQRALGIAGGR